MAGPTRRIFTDQFLRSLKRAEKPYKRSESAPKGEGRMIVRVLPSGSKELFYRYRVDGGDTLLALGRFDPDGNTGITLSQAREKLKEARQEQREHGDVKAHREEEDRQSEIAARKGTFRQLLSAYVQNLRDAGKVSAGKVDGLFRRAVLDHFAALADTKADEIRPEEVTLILGRMVRKGHTRQVNLTRAYLRAAFAYGIKADHDPRTIAREGALFGLKYNPAATVLRIAEYERAGERVLSDAELREYWKGLEALPLVQRCALRFNLALACQRPTQLLRAKWAAFDFAKGKETLLLRDSKGKGQPREHLLPLTAFALEQLKPLREANSKTEASAPFTADGKRIMVLETLSEAVHQVSQALKKEPHKIPAFQQRDLRRTSETMLQQLGVVKEVRAHLLSHGRSQGVQGRHYERYDFLPEKRAALEKWALHLERIITGKTADVVPITAGARSPRGRRAVGAK